MFRELGLYKVHDSTCLLRSESCCLNYLMIQYKVLTLELANIITYCNKSDLFPLLDCLQVPSTVTDTSSRVYLYMIQ